jgi:uncharacterized protein YxeA
MKKTVVLVVALVIVITGGIVLFHNRFAPSPQGSASNPALQKAKMIKMDSFMVENVTLDQVIDTLKQQVALRHGGFDLRLAATAKEKEQTPITLNLQHTSLAEILDRVAAAADLNLLEEDNVIVLVPKKKSL